MKTVSFDVWGTLLESNPEFKISQGNLAKTFSGCNPEDFLKRKSEIKKELDLMVEAYGIQPNRITNYEKLLPDLTISEINSFIKYSDKLFLKYPPKIIEKGKKLLEYYKLHGYVILISSNTVFIYGDILSKIIWNYFEIPIHHCNFSDIIKFSKPNPKMFNFQNKPEFHVGDNIITDGSCKETGINFININDADI